MPWIKLPDGTRAHVKLSGRKTRLPPPCAVREGGSKCGCLSGYLCDYVVNDEGATCDMPICQAHAHVVGVDLHHCPKHYKPQEAA